MRPGKRWATSNRMGGLNILAILPWALFGIMVLFNLVFLILAFRATRRANDFEAKAEAAQQQVALLTQRSQTAESRIQQAEQRSLISEQQVAHAEERATKAREVAKAAEARAAEAESRAGQALDEARRADASLRERKNEIDERQRKAEARAKALLDWARSQWEARREMDRQKAQAQQGVFQVQLEAFLGYRRAPVAFRVDNDIDRLAAPLLVRHVTSEKVEVQGDLVQVTFAVDAALGFRA